MFNYNGYTKEQLFRLCNRKLSCRSLAKRIYWTSETYSIGRYLREYASYPSWLPLYVYAQHGAAYDPVIAPHEINNDAEAMLVYNTASFENYQKVSDKPCYLVTMPYVLNRRAKNITVRADAKGALVFPSHSTMELDVLCDLDKYAADLKSLPADFHPLCVCLHRSDIVKGLHLEFMKRGFPVYSAGDPNDIFFGDRLYDLLHNFKYAMSNHVGSYAYYSVEMGVPFSLFGEESQLINRSDPNIPVGLIDLASNEYYQEEVKIFSGLYTEITAVQKEFVDYVLGVGQGLTGPQLGKVLRDAYKNRGRLPIDAIRAAGRKIKRAATGRNR